MSNNSTNGIEYVPSKTVAASPKFDVYVERVEVQNEPASVIIYVNVGSTLRFCSTIRYHSIENWQNVWGNDRVLQAHLLAILVAWDCMRFLALGGTRLILPEDLSCSLSVAKWWKHCFLNQFGEWRFLNQIVYPSSNGPTLVASFGSTNDRISSPAYKPSDAKWLVANGGGKDTLAGLLLLEEAGIQFDFYQGYLPLGGPKEIQATLLDGFRRQCSQEARKIIEVSVDDDFYNRRGAVLKEAGIQVKHFDADFAVGHTANYIGYFPLILAHGYERILFNIERSADRTMQFWNDEPINHQWCKSIEYQEIAKTIFKDVTGGDWFVGFGSTLRNFYDLSIYKLIGKDHKLLLNTHSCNIQKPWCRCCPKCCFCYLMMTAFFGEEFAMQVVGTEHSLFSDKECLDNWENLLNPTKVAWECVASQKECLVAVDYCLTQGLTYDVLKRYWPGTEMCRTLEKTFLDIEWKSGLRQLEDAARGRLLNEAFVTRSGIVQNF